MDVFSAPEVGSAEAIQGRGSTAGTSTDILYPVSKLVKGQFQPGRTLEFNWKSSPDRWWHPKSTRLVVHYKATFGEVDSTCTDPIAGPAEGVGVRPSKSVSFTPLPNTSLFGTGQARYVNNGVVCESTNHLYDQSMVQLLLTQNSEAGQGTSASNMLTDLSKSSGLPNSSYFDGSYKADGSEGFSMLPVVAAPYYESADVVTGTGTSSIDGTTALGNLATKEAAGGRTALVEVVAFAKSATTFTVTSEFGAVIKVNDKLTVKTAGANSFALGSGETTVTANEPTSGADTRTITISKASGTAGDADADTVLQVEGNDFDAEKMTIGSLAGGLAVKVKGDTYKRGGMPNSRFEILQQGFVPNSTAANAGGVCEMQVSEPVLLSTWSASNFCQGPGDNSLFLTVSPDFASTLFYDHSGEYAAQEAAINCNGDGSDVLRGSSASLAIAPRSIAVSIESVELHVSYIHPATSYIPKSLSIRWAPIQVSTRKIEGDSVAEGFVVPPNTKSVLLFMRQKFAHICADRAELSLAAGGVNIMGTKHTWQPKVDDKPSDDAAAFGIRGVALEKNKNGKFMYDNQAMLIDPDIDPRLKRPVKPDSNDPLAFQTTDIVDTAEPTRPYGWQTLQVSLGGKSAPREMLTNMEPQSGRMSRLFNLYLSFIGRSQGYRGSALSFSEFCSYHNSNYSSGALCGDRGPFAVFDMEQPQGSIATDLQVRGQLLGKVKGDAQQELVCVAVSDSIWNVGYNAPSATPVLTQVAPIIS
jgi:hypothetical protein